MANNHAGLTYDKSKQSQVSNVILRDLVSEVQRACLRSKTQKSCGPDSSINPNFSSAIENTETVHGNVVGNCPECGAPIREISVEALRVNLNTVLEFFQVSNFSNPSSDEIILLSVAYFHGISEAERQADGFNFQCQRPF